MLLISDKTKLLLEEKFLKYNQVAFIENDPVCIPHRFTTKQDIEIAAFFAAILAWGQRKTIISKCNELMERMDNSPYEFIMNASAADLKNLEGFKHRTFNDFDLLFLADFFKNHYTVYSSLEDAFLLNNEDHKNIKNNLIAFKEYVFTEGKLRTAKHISSPASNSACKRLNMFLRWMVRSDQYGVDFGIWTRLKPVQLVVPCDVHVERIARHLLLTERPKADWHMAEEITEKLKQIDSNDPAKYDFSLFGMGVENYFGIN